MTKQDAKGRLSKLSEFVANLPDGATVESAGVGYRDGASLSLIGDDEKKRAQARAIAKGNKITRELYYPKHVKFTVDNIDISIWNYPSEYVTECESKEVRKCYRVYPDGRRVEMSSGEDSEAVE